MRIPVSMSFSREDGKIINQEVEQVDPEVIFKIMLDGLKELSEKEI